MLLASLIAFELATIVLSIAAIEFADRREHQRRRAEADYWRGQVERAQRRHAPSKDLQRKFVEVRRKELAHGQ